MNLAIEHGESQETLSDWKNYQKLEQHQIGPDTVIRLTTVTSDGAEDREHTHILRHATTENIKAHTYNDAEGGKIVFVDYGPKHNLRGFYVQFPESHPRFVDLSNYENYDQIFKNRLLIHHFGGRPSPLLSIVDSTNPDVIGKFGSQFRSLRVGAASELGGYSPISGFYLGDIHKIEGHNVLPDELTPKVEALLKKYYRGKMSGVMDARFREFFDLLESSGQFIISKDAHRAETIDVLDIHTRVTFLIQQWMIEAEKTGTLPMEEEEFLEVMNTLKEFIDSDFVDDGGMVACPSANVRINNGEGVPSNYSMAAAYRHYDNRTLHFSIKKNPNQS